MVVEFSSREEIRQGSCQKEGRRHRGARRRGATLLRQEDALLRIASLAYKPFDARLREIVRLDAATLDVARVSFWSRQQEPEAIRCEALYLLRSTLHS